MRTIGAELGSAYCKMKIDKLPEVRRGLSPNDHTHLFVTDDLTLAFQLGADGHLDFLDGAWHLLTLLRDDPFAAETQMSVVVDGQGFRTFL